MSAFLSRRKTALQSYDSHIGPNMTPMVDVVMVILIFFMASASILGPTWLLKSSLPPKPSPNVQPPKDELVRMRVELSFKDGKTITKWTEAVGESAPIPGVGTGASLNAFQGRLEELSTSHKPEKIVVLIEPANDVPYSDVVQIHAICQKLGIDKVGLASTEK
jgi:biopolymer transport protein ExbD